MKPCQVFWQKLVIQEKIYSVKEKSSCFIENQTEWEVYMHLSNRSVVREVFSYCNSGKIREKMANFRNHWRFTIKCLKNDIIPVSVRFKTNIHTTKGLDIIRRVEKQLLNECMRSIKNQLEMFMFKRDTCTLKLKDILDHGRVWETN